MHFNKRFRICISKYSNFVCTSTPKWNSVITMGLGDRDFDRYNRPRHRYNRDRYNRVLLVCNYAVGTWRRDFIL
ncbi:hypothetical protein T11_18384 [Trichinella zimbabwensis]|uniref:Uncharacterized protein n=1 Tax=Trichinella zimbabwensis TaxID=268475 RepID=A0A0V1H2R3_9BILA|nr:hypothetical protein T11_18384 [Trichinella zimbabwensis]